MAEIRCEKKSLASNSGLLLSGPFSGSALQLNPARVLVSLCSVVRLPPGGGNVPLADFSGAVLPFPAAAAAGRPVPRPAEAAPRPAPAPDEGPAGVLPPAPQGQEQHHLQPGGGRQPDPQPHERR